MSTNVQSRTNWQVKPNHDLFFRMRPGLFRRYRPDRDPPPIYRGSLRTVNSVPVADDEEMADDEEATASQQSEIFAYESHLRDYLADNLGVLEPGLKLFEDKDIPGIEYPIHGRRIDLLAVAQDGSLVVIELKVSKGHDRTIGQILTYMGWVRQDLAGGKSVRGMIVAHTLSDELLTAAHEANANIRLFEYDISFHVRPKG
jgi:RecB family endonuclease NucS